MERVPPVIAANLNNNLHYLTFIVLKLNKVKEQEKIITFLKERPAISKNAIEIICGLPQGTLSKAVNNVQPLADRHLPALKKELKRYGYQ